MKLRCAGGSKLRACSGRLLDKQLLGELLDVCSLHSGVGQRVSSGPPSNASRNIRNLNRVRARRRRVRRVSLRRVVVWRVRVVRMVRMVRRLRMVVVRRVRVVKMMRVIITPGIMKWARRTPR